MSTSTLEAPQHRQDLSKRQPPNDLKNLFATQGMQEQIARALPKHMTADRMLRVATTALLRTPKLNDCSQASVIKCMLDLSAAGLEPDGRRAHLIPYGAECTVVIDYKGIVELAMRSGLIANIHADVVCENDTFRYDRGQITEHTIDFKKPRGEAYAFYALIRFKDGTEKAEVMSKEEVEKIRKRSRAANSGPWVTDFSEMGKKTVFKRASKWLPLSPELATAFEIDDQEFPHGNTHQVSFTKPRFANARPANTPDFTPPSVPQLSTLNSQPEKDEDEDQIDTTPSPQGQQSPPSKESAPHGVPPSGGSTESASSSPNPQAPASTPSPTPIERVQALLAAAGIDFAALKPILIQHHLIGKRINSLEALGATHLDYIQENWTEIHDAIVNPGAQ